MEENIKLPVDGERLREFTRVLQKYKAGKASIERRTIAAENWWKLRNQAEERKSIEGLQGFQAVSGWLHNIIVSKHGTPWRPTRSRRSCPGRRGTGRRPGCCPGSSR